MAANAPIIVTGRSSRAPALRANLQERKNDDEDEKPGFEQRLVDFIDRRLDESRCIEGDLRRPLGELLR